MNGQTFVLAECSQNASHCSLFLLGNMGTSFAKNQDSQIRSVGNDVYLWTMSKGFIGGMHQI